VEGRSEMREIPVLHYNEQVHDQDEGCQKRTGQLCVTRTNRNYDTPFTSLWEVKNLQTYSLVTWVCA
jgi:hypothetical protein